MATLIAVYNSDGCVGRCDARCYEATCPECDCICGGKNHGAGYKQALDNTREYFNEWLDQYTKEKGIKDGVGRLATEVLQLNLF